MPDRAPYYLDYCVGDTRPFIYLEFENEDITGYTFELTVNYQQGTCLVKSGTIKEPNLNRAVGAGIACIEWVSGDLNQKGIHPCSIQITDTLGGVESYKNFALRIT